MLHERLVHSTIHVQSVNPFDHVVLAYTWLPAKAVLTVAYIRFVYIFSLFPEKPYHYLLSSLVHDYATVIFLYITASA